jgi:hypothetical protein
MLKYFQLAEIQREYIVKKAFVKGFKFVLGLALL